MRETYIRRIAILNHDVQKIDMENHNTFNDDSKREKFIKFNSSEQVKGQDCLNYQKARFYHLLFEAFGIEMVNRFVPYLQIFCSSTEECEQICASEIVAGLMRGKYLTILTYISFSSSNTQFYESRILISPI